MLIVAHVPTVSSQSLHRPAGPEATHTRIPVLDFGRVHTTPLLKATPRFIYRPTSVFTHLRRYGQANTHNSLSRLIERTHPVIKTFHTTGVISLRAILI